MPFERCGMIHSEEHTLKQQYIIDQPKVIPQKVKLSITYITLPVQDMEPLDQRIKENHKKVQSFYSDICDFELKDVLYMKCRKEPYTSFLEMMDDVHKEVDWEVGYNTDITVFITRHANNTLGLCDNVPGRLIMVDDRTVVDKYNGLESYDSGGTLIHQIGHALGLSHPFAYGSCEAPLIDLGLPKAKHPNYFHKDNNNRDYQYYCKDMPVEEICKDGGCNNKLGPPWGCYYKSKNDCGSIIPKEKKQYMMDFTQDSDILPSAIPEKAKQIIRYNLQQFHNAKQVDTVTNNNVLYVIIAVLLIGFTTVVVYKNHKKGFTTIVEEVPYRHSIRVDKGGLLD